ncbi:hypothetical protein OIU84_014976 [Salix udensis]|uniref:Uncharacterized protein n=1 Tax=Salix udensis TaxID=889485 RepID=A0AAD6NSK1_9ROSI|nr:hypothetical protein OIU84_014976 [Salix udensis]
MTLTSVLMLSCMLRMKKHSSETTLPPIRSYQNWGSLQGPLYSR